MLQRIFIFLVVTTLLFSSFLISPSLVSAATFRSGESLMVDQALTDLYVTGNTVSITAPVTNDLTVAAGTINLEAPVSGGVLASGGTINLDGEIAQTLRAAGGTINISAPIGRDAVLFGGTISLSQTASVSGDVVINGGSITIEGPVLGNVIVNGGNVVLNSHVSGNVSGDIERLVLGNNALVEGNLEYTSPERAILRDGAQLRGVENYEQSDGDGMAEEKIAGLFTTFALYKLLADILGSLALIYFLYRFTKRVIEFGTNEPLKTGLLGLATLIIAPIIGILLLFLILPGIVVLLVFALLLLISAFISKIIIGNMVLRWWYKRNKSSYQLDWKAAVVGPILMFVLLVIPIIGWFLGFLFYLVAMGSILMEMFTYITSPKTAATIENTSSKTPRILASSKKTRRGK